jgi:hypothetical protein
MVPVASGNMTETQDADFCIILWPKSWVDCCILSVPGNEYWEDLADCWVAASWV